MMLTISFRTKSRLTLVTSLMRTKPFIASYPHRRFLSQKNSEIQKNEESSDMLDFLNNPHETSAAGEKNKQPELHVSDVFRNVSLYTHNSDAPPSNTGKIFAFIVVAGIILFLWNLDYIRGHLKSKQKHNFDRLLAEMKTELLITETSAVIEADSKCVDAYYFRGLAYFVTEDWVNALTDFEKVVSLNDRAHLAVIASALTYSGYAFSSLGEDDNALTVLNQALEINPKSVAALRGKGEVLCGKKDWTGALECYDKVSELDPKDKFAQHYRAMLLHRLGKNKEALEITNKLLVKDFFDLEAQIKKATILISMKQYDEALSWLNDILGLFPDCAEAMIMKGDVLNQLKRPDEALFAYERAAYILPEQKKLRSKIENLTSKPPTRSSWF